MDADLAASVRWRYSLCSWGVRITPGGVDELPLSLFTVVIGVLDKNDEKLGPLLAMKPKKIRNHSFRDMWEGTHLSESTGQLLRA